MTRFGALAAVLALGLVGCTNDTSDSDDSTGDEALTSFFVNGHALTNTEGLWMRRVASDVVPRLQGTRDQRLTAAAQGSWWALKEGDWELKSAAGYSLCNSASGDHVIGPLDICGQGRAWQVGYAGVQVPGHKLADLEALAKKLYPETTSDVLLQSIATLAGYAPGGDTSKAIVASTGTLRASWLLRVPAIGFTTAVTSEVIPECINGTRGWCFGSGWDETKKFSATRTAANTSIADLRGLLDKLSP